MSKILSSAELIKALSDIFGPSGCEDSVAKLILELTADLGIIPKKDRLGNISFCLGADGTNKKKIMLSAHMDEVGFMVTDVTDKGYLKFSNVGGISPDVTAGRHVLVGAEENHICGVIASKAIHHKDREDRLKPEKKENLVIDIGAKTEDEAKAIADIGTFVSFAPNFSTFGKNGRMMHSKALDDRFGCALLVELLRKLKEIENKLPLEVYVCFTTREEVGISGATVAANIVRPDYAVVLETTAVADRPDAPESSHVAKVGEGGALSLMDRSTIYDRELIDIALTVAKENNIKVQVKKFVSGGNDAGHIHKSCTGVRTLALSAPTRYLHSPNCVASLDDYEAMLDLLYKFILTEKLR